MNAYRCRVPATNAFRNKWPLGGGYHDCIDGVVYVLAKDMEDAARQIPNADEIEKVGVAYVAEKE